MVATSGSGTTFKWLREVTCDPSLTTAAQALAAYIFTRAKNEDGTLFLSREYAAEEIGRPLSNVKRALDQLRGFGYLTQTKRGSSKGDASEYVLTLRATGVTSDPSDGPGSRMTLVESTGVTNDPGTGVTNDPGTGVTSGPPSTNRTTNETTDHSSARSAGADQRGPIPEGWTPNKAHAAKCPNGLSADEVGEKFRELAVERKLTSADWNKKFGGFLGYLDGVVERYAAGELTGPIVWADHLEDYLFGGAEQFTPKGMPVDCPF
ncbi:hypothetical protein ACXYTP_05120 [Tsukamurella ocularis]|uniref:hypothetical protein n=1 Tax=Tsukamurella ocularis TaxID=1970234 RepID=UPI0039EFFC82